MKLKRPDHCDYNNAFDYQDDLDEYADYLEAKVHELETQAKVLEGSRAAEAQATINQLMARVTELEQETQTSRALDSEDRESIIDGQAKTIAGMTQQLADCQARLHAIGILTR